MPERNRKVGSIKGELIKKSRESALAAVQIFNNPNIGFKSETFVVLMIIAWTYLLHAYYRGQKIEYRYFEQKGTRKKFDKTKHGAHKHWELERCLNDKRSPIDTDAKNNLKFIIGLRHEIEHQMTNRIDDLLSARFQACCLNYNKYIKDLFDEKFGIEKHLSFSLQFSSISAEQKEMLQDYKGLPANIQGYIDCFDNALSDEEYRNPSYAYRILFVPKQVNHRGQADRVIEFVKADSPEAEVINKEYAVIKETEKQKFLPSQVVEKMNELGFEKFNMYQHTQLWKSKNAKDPKNAFGVNVAGNWYWYSRWLDIVREFCEKKYPKN